MSKIEMHPVKSSNLESVGYDEKESILQVKFLDRRSGKTYQYKDVPKMVYNEMVTASSIGSYFQKYIRPIYHYREV